jgi:hypothetical protein
MYPKGTVFYKIYIKGGSFLSISNIPVVVLKKTAWKLNRIVAQITHKVQSTTEF